MTDAMAALLLFAVDPAGTGIVLRSPAGPPRDAWLAALRAALPAAAALRRVPLNVPDDRLLGGVDLAATLAAGRPVQARGLLAEAEGGVLLLAMAERLPPGTAARIAAASELGARFGVVALDEGVDEEQPPSGLVDRLAFLLDLSAAPGEDEAMGDVAAARVRLPGVSAGDDTLEALCGTAAALGIVSMRAPLLALRAALAAAALAGRCVVAPEDAALAARLVLAPRATRLPQPAPDAGGEEQADAEPPAPEPDPAPDPAPDHDSSGAGDPVQDRVLEAASAAIPAGLLAQLQEQAARGRAKAPGRAGAPLRAGRRGRPAGVRPGDPRRGLRLNLIETLRAAAPWQGVRRAPGQLRLVVRPGDFRVTHMTQRAETTTIFAVDASGSAALARLAEAKGAVELLLAECYVRRDRVAVVAFRGRGAQVLLAPTRSLVRAKRSLAGLPGGGGTPLAAGIEAGAALAADVRRRGGTPTLVLLTDGRANVTREGKGNRARAEEEALAAAGRLREAGARVLLVDTSARPHPPNLVLAARMGARYVALPYADAASVSRAVQAHR